MKKKSILLMIVLVFCCAFLVGCGSKTTAPVEPKSITVTDQLGRTAEIPNDVKRIVVLQHHTLDILLELGQGDKLVGVLDTYQSNLGDYILEVDPGLKSLPTPGGLDKLDVEAVAALKPDVVFLAQQLPEEYYTKLNNLGIPCVTLCFYIADKMQASTLSPNLEDPELAYKDGLPEAINIIATVCRDETATKRAVMLIDDINKTQTMLAERLSGLAAKDKVQAYMANPKGGLQTYGTGKYVGVAMNHAGLHNVAETIKGYTTVSIEQVYKWNPQVIFVQDRYKSTLDEIKNTPSWAEIDAVKNGKLYMAPEYTKIWGHPTPESIILGELWLAKTFYPDRFADINLDERVQNFYKTYYGVPYTEDK